MLKSSIQHLSFKLLFQCTFLFWGGDFMPGEFFIVKTYLADFHLSYRIKRGIIKNFFEKTSKSSKILRTLEENRLVSICVLVRHTKRQKMHACRHSRKHTQTHRQKERFPRTRCRGERLIV